MLQASSGQLQPQHAVGIIRRPNCSALLGVNCVIRRSEFLKHLQVKLVAAQKPPSAAINHTRDKRLQHRAKSATSESGISSW